MEKCNFIKIKEKGIYGIKNANLNVCLASEKENVKYIVKVDNHNFDCEIITRNNNEVVITSKLQKNSREVLIIAKYKNKNYLVCKLNNTLIYRIYKKFVCIKNVVVSKIKSLIRVFVRGIKFLWREHHFLVPPSLWGKYFKLLIEKIKHGGVSIHYNPFIKSDYQKWLEENNEIEEEIKLKYNPLISILIPVYNIGRKYLSECIDSILNQTYENFEICLVDDCSTNEETKKVLKEYESKDSRVKVKYRKQNGHISKATNDALKMATGEFIALVDNDDVLVKNALYEVVRILNEDKKLDFIYSDEDKLDLKGNRCAPNFKPDYSPDTLLSLNYICHLAVIRKSIVDDINGFTVGLEGAQDYDLFLRVAEKTNKIYHIPKILYHWRMVEGSTSMTIKNKDYAADKGKKAIENALKRRKIKGHVEKDEASTYYRVIYDYNKEPMISIIIPTKDYAETLDTCLKSVYEKTTYKNYEVIVVNNNSEKEETFELFEKYKKEFSNFRVVDANMEFNYSKINNIAVKASKGDYIMLLNNDTEVISPDWLNVMVGYAMQPHIGAVGPKLLYPDMTVQHAGVVLGLGGVASHAYIGFKRDDLGMYGRLRVPYDYSAVTAACLLVSKKKFNEVKGLEEELMVAYNDMDFNIKLLKKGYYNIFIPQVELIHFESKSRGLDTTSEKYKRFLKESDYMYTKWGNELKNDKYYNPNFSKTGNFLLDKKDSKK